ncbi:MAG: chaperone NapD [Helicobacter sp.]|uniref:chaperone NapD n=1 Tax=Helicobacter sp. TaxID=218 RepID=UPI0025BA8941|nr:chaperone NapD [Helicobacter sp.]MCH5313962.1 chaperone NapD [Helicobacter sp.]
MNISSIVVRTTQEHFESVKDSIQALQYCEIYIADKPTNQIIVVIESPSTQEEVALNKHIESLTGVLSANMHYAYQEGEINAQLKEMDNGISEFLNNDSISAEHITYSGSVAHLMGEKSHKKKRK